MRSIIAGIAAPPIGIAVAWFLTALASPNAPSPNVVAWSLFFPMFFGLLPAYLTEALAYGLAHRWLVSHGALSPAIVSGIGALAGMLAWGLGWLIVANFNTDGLGVLLATGFFGGAAAGASFWAIAYARTTRHRDARPTP